MEKYRAILEGYMTVGEVAKKMNVTVRTLQHYDKEGLLSPSAVSEGGRRLLVAENPQEQPRVILLGRGNAGPEQLLVQRLLGDLRIRDDVRLVLPEQVQEQGSILLQGCRRVCLGQPLGCLDTLDNFSQCHLNTPPFSRRA